MVRQLNQTHTLPPNPHWIEFVRTDGDADRLPKDTTFNPDSQGHVNFMRPVGDEESASIGWRIAFGKALASKLGMPIGPAYVLKSWPEGYGMFDHNKGPSEKPRHDPYLIGSTHVKRFRSVPEFTPHAFWLMTDSTLSRSNCQCKYCSGTSQTVISERDGLRVTPSQSSNHDSSTPGPGASSSRGTMSRLRAARQQPTSVPKTMLKKSRNYTIAEIEETVLTGRAQNEFTGDTVRYADLRASTSMSKSCLPRWHRLQEVVWCKLPIPIGPIQYWPGLISNYKVKSAALSLATNVSGSNKEPWTISQWTIYELKMFGIGGKLLNVRDKVILPYQMYSPPAGLWTRVGPYVTAPEVLNWDEVENFDPFAAHQAHPLIGDSRKIEDLDEEVLMAASIPFATAVSHAAHMATHWTPSHLISRSFTGVADSSGVEKISSRGARLKKDLPVAQVQLDSQGRPMDVVPRPQGAAKRNEYQGIWFGPERIWISDFVRLKCLRGECWPQGHEMLFDSSGPSSMGQTERDDGQLPNVGADQRGTFLFIRSFRKSEPDESTGKFNVEVYGYLYEMAWADSPAMLDKDAYKKYDLPVSPGTQAEKSASPYRLPPAPTGFAWRPMLRPGYEVKVSSGLIAGRYYGRLHEHPLLADSAPNAAQTAFEPYISSMYGFSAGSDNSISVGTWNAYRGKADDMAKSFARLETEQYRQQQDDSAEIKYEDYLHEEVDQDMG